MKAKITKEFTKKGESVFFVFANDSVVDCFHFKPEILDENNIWNEKWNYDKAMNLAKLIESHESLPIIETVYETPINKESIKM